MELPEQGDKVKSWEDGNATYFDCCDDYTVVYDGVAKSRTGL